MTDTAHEPSSACNAGLWPHLFLTLPRTRDARSRVSSYDIGHSLVHEPGASTLLHERDNPMHGVILALGILTSLVLCLLSVLMSWLIWLALPVSLFWLAIAYLLLSGRYDRAHRNAWRQREAMAAENALLQVLARHPDAAGDLLSSPNRILTISQPRSHLDGSVTATAIAFGRQAHAVLLEPWENDRRTWFAIKANGLAIYEIRRTSAHEALQARREAIIRSIKL